MIKKIRYKGFHTYIKNNNQNLLEIFESILACNTQDINVLRVFKSETETHVSLLSTKYGKYILKIQAPKDKFIERFVKSFLSVGYNVNLIKKIDEASEQGYTFPNDFFLLAEKRILKFAKISIMLFEYIEGEELTNLPVVSDEIKLEIKKSMHKLHEMKIISSDPHKGNFIITDNGIRIIDLSGKPYTTKRVVEDNLTIHTRIGVPIEVKSFRQKMLIAKMMRRDKKLRQRKSDMHQ